MSHLIFYLKKSEGLMIISWPVDQVRFTAFDNTIYAECDGDRQTWKHVDLVNAGAFINHCLEDTGWEPKRVTLNFNEAGTLTSWE